jgi:hypothetical protein
MLYRASQDSANAFSNSRSRAFQELPAGLDTGDRSIELLFDRECCALRSSSGTFIEASSFVPRITSARDAQAPDAAVPIEELVP